MIFKSPHAPVSIPSVSLTNYVLERADRYGTKPALVDGSTGRTITYAQLRQAIDQLSAGFAAHGIAKGDVFAIYSPNVPEYALTFHALAQLGAITTMVPPLFTEQEVHAQLRGSHAKYLLTIPPLLDAARNVAQAAAIETLFVIGEDDGAISLTALLQSQAGKPVVAIDPDVDLAALPYSSGTTGFPKPVMLTHRNMVAMLCQMEVTNAFEPDDVLICVVPMYHLYGLHIVANLGLRQGATIVTMPRYDENQFLSVLQDYKVTVAPIVPPIVLTLARSPRPGDFDLSSLRLIHCGAAPLADNIARECSARFGCPIRFGYGLTEVSPLSHATFPSDDQTKPGSVGQCLPNTECKIVDYNTGAELGPNEEGEIWVRGPQVMKGYLNDADATAQMIDDQGWLRSGDIGYADEEGRLFVVDRLKELIKYKGRQVAPAELEKVLLSHPAVADAAVIPLHDEAAGEVPKGFVVLKSKATADELMQFVAERVAPHKRIRAVEFVQEIPKTPAGKILRRKLRAQP
jgi:acyl-CoA synthetase (AMP-forming)/AMP-acid ligase II